VTDGDDGYYLYESGGYYLVCEFNGCMSIMALRGLADSTDGRRARRLGTVESQWFTVLAAHQRLKTLLDHGVEFTAL